MLHKMAPDLLIYEGERSADVRRGGRVVTEHSLNDSSMYNEYF